MATRSTVDRQAALVRRIARLDGDARRREALASGVIDAVLEADGDTLAATLDALRERRAQADEDAQLAGWLDAAIAFAHWGLERVPSQAAVAQGTQAHDFLRALDGSRQVASAELRQLLEVDETQVSRTGRQLLEGGLVIRRKVGRHVFWALSPRGERALAEAPAPRRSPNSSFWQEALRRGFDAVYGDQPGEPRQVDPTRERIIESTFELHGIHGVQATTWPQIADRSGVSEETVKALFPSLDELVRSCGAHFMESLAIAPADRAGEMFTGASSQHDRIHRLVETLFGVYERGADGMEVARRERQEVPALDESVVELEAAFDALVAEALRPRPVDDASVASLRALTGLEVWRSLRDQGATPDSAVDTATQAVERWLQAHPALVPVSG